MDSSRFPKATEKILIEVSRYTESIGHYVQLDPATYKGLMKRVTVIALKYTVEASEVQHHWEDEISGGEGSWDRSQHEFVVLRNAPR